MLEPFPKEWIYDQISCEIFNFHINFPHRISPHTSSLYQYLHKVIGLKTLHNILPYDGLKTERNQPFLILASQENAYPKKSLTDTFWASGFLISTEK